jgi:hypothetical protein
VKTSKLTNSLLSQIKYLQVHFIDLNSFLKVKICSVLVSVMGLNSATTFLEWFSMFIILITSVWWYFKSKYNFWKKKGVKFITPVIPFGNIRDVFLLRKPTAEVVKEFYDAFPEERFVGLYEAMNPLILIRDPELIKHVMVKDFSHFQVQYWNLVQF